MELGSYIKIDIGIGTPVKIANVKHTRGLAGAGIKESYYLLPSDVSFSKLTHMEGSDSGNDGKVSNSGSGFFTLVCNNVKSMCQPYWEIVDNPNSSQAEVDMAKQKLMGIESSIGGIHCVDKARFFYHRETGNKFGILAGIHHLSGKPNTQEGEDGIIFGHYGKNSYGITTPVGFIDGTFNWSISQTYWTNQHDDNTKVQDFSTIDQNAIIEQSGRMTANKGNAIGSASLDAPTSNFE
ncbi:MAG: hypothetical protein LBJ00_09705 [Planctomycetaceae bacterium]|jgi:hypothetical protein|nr:hypothetical protein [Planctomycetaceae bacterium]